MSEYKVRPFESLSDAVPQYELWLKATASLPRPWRSCLLNVQHQLEYARKHPQSRLYAECENGSFCGYIGTHPPFEWIGAEHGPPTESLGWTIPFGFPWTYPFDSSLADQLYQRMMDLIPTMYSDYRRDVLIQRFRESWSPQLEFVQQRGWSQILRAALFGREIPRGHLPSTDLRAANRNDLSLVCELSRVDEISQAPLSLDSLQFRFDAGWIVHDTFYCLGDRGAFVLESRGDYAAITVLYAQTACWHETVRSAMAQAGRLKAKEVYFTLEAKDETKRMELEKMRFGEVDAGVYYVRDSS